MATTLEQIEPTDQWIVNDQGLVTGIRLAGKPAIPSSLVTAQPNTPTSMVKITQAAYDALTPDPNTIYLITS